MSTIDWPASVTHWKAHIISNVVVFLKKKNVKPESNHEETMEKSKMCDILHDNYSGHFKMSNVMKNKLARKKREIFQDFKESKETAKP